MNLFKALKQYADNAQFILRGNTYDGLEWLDASIPKPSMEQLESCYSDALAYEAKVAYKALRAPEYPPIQEQLDMLWHAMDVGSFPKCNLFYSMLKSVKDKYPKPE